MEVAQFSNQRRKKKSTQKSFCTKEWSFQHGKRIMQLCLLHGKTFSFFMQKVAGRDLLPWHKVF